MWQNGLFTVVGIFLTAFVTYVFNSRARREERAEVARQETLQRQREVSLRIIDGQIVAQEKKLEIFLWPLTLYLGIDEAVWEKVPGLIDGSAALPSRAGQSLEAQLLLPNHFRAVELIERNFHLVAEERDLLQPMIDYVQHVAIYRALRETKSNLNPIGAGAPFPSTLPICLERVLLRTRNELAALKRRRAKQANVLIVNCREHSSSREAESQSDTAVRPASMHASTG